MRRLGLWGGLWLALSAVALTAGSARAEDRDSNTLQIGLVKSLFRDTPPTLVKVMSRPLKSLMDSQTGYSGELNASGEARELARMMKEGKAHLGVFHGFEFAWAREVNPELKPLVICVHQYPQLHAFLMVRKDGEINNIAALKGKTVGIPQRSREHIHLYLERRCTEGGEPAAKYFGKIAKPATPEDALDDVVDGAAEACLVDRIALEEYERNKPERFAQLHAIASSEAFPAAVIAYQPGSIAEATAQRFREGMIAASNTVRGKELLKLCRITAFQPVPVDYEQQLQVIGKAYPVKPVKD